ncbi:MAG: acyl-CoA thioesterase [Saprospiraceae bacterium]|jgi:acyl-CoA thioester hydrolase|nr:acyl-CoA thioesterase [Saprospiraceae bacterium]
MYIHEYKERVRYGQTDQMGYLYYGRYADFYEIGRVEMLRALGLTYKEMEEEHRVMLPVASMESRYIRPAKYDELLTVRTTLREFPHDQHMTFHVEVFNEKGKLCNGGRVRLVFVDMNTMRSMPAPEFFTRLLLPYFPEAAAKTALTTKV